MDQSEINISQSRCQRREIHPEPYCELMRDEGERAVPGRAFRDVIEINKDSGFTSRRSVEETKERGKKVWRKMLANTINPENNLVIFTQTPASADAFKFFILKRGNAFKSDSEILRCARVMKMDGGVFKASALLSGILALNENLNLR